MSIYTELLGINMEAAENVAIVYSGQAMAMEHAEQTTGAYLPWIASSWAIAAVYQLLVEPARARPLFLNAANYYRELGNPIWRLCQICSGSPLSEENPEKHMGWQFQNTVERFYVLLQNKLINSIDTFQRETEEFSGRIPELNIPYELVLQAVSELDFTERDGRIMRFDHFKELMSRLSENILMQRNDNEYWHNLKGQIIPFEPATIAIAVVLVKIWQKHSSLSELLRRSELQDYHSFLLNIADDLFS